LGTIPAETEDYIVIYKPLNANVSPDKQIVKLGKSLPSDVMNVKVTYLPLKFFNQQENVPSSKLI